MQRNYLKEKNFFKRFDKNNHCSPNLRGIDYLVVGGLAVNLFGVPRLTYDIDLMIQMESKNIKKLISKLTEWGYKPKIPVDPFEFVDEAKRNLWISEKGLKAFNFYNEQLPISEIDIIIDSPIPYGDLKKRAAKIQIQDVTIPVVSIQDLIELKLHSGCRIFKDNYGEMMEEKKGFSYFLTKEQLEEYRSWPIERRLKWLLIANKLRRYLPKKTIEIQEAFRQGKI